MQETGKVIVQTDAAPVPIGPYSQAVKAGDLVFVAGQLGIDPASGELAAADAAGQTRRIMENIQAILEMAGSGLGRIVKTTIFVVDLRDFGEINKVYAEFFPFEQPARSTVQVAALPMGGRVEIEAVAVLTQSAGVPAGGGLGGY